MVMWALGRLDLGVILFSITSLQIIDHMFTYYLVGNRSSWFLPIHWADHEETVPELLGDVGQVPCLGAHHTPVVHQAVLMVMKGFFHVKSPNKMQILCQHSWRSR